MSDPPDPIIDPPAGGSIVVSGTGSVSVSPDVAHLRLGVAIAGPTVDAARAQASPTMEAILAAIAGAGVASRDVRTAMLSLQPRYDYRDGTAPTLVGYELSNVVEVTIRDLERVGDVVDGTLKAGATSMDSLSFRVADPAHRHGCVPHALKRFSPAAPAAPAAPPAPAAPAAPPAPPAPPVFVIQSCGCCYPQTLAQNDRKSSHTELWLLSGTNSDPQRPTVRA